MEKEVMITSKLIFFLLIVFILFHFLAIYNFWYWKFRWLDIPMHFIGGILVSMFFVWLDSKFKILNTFQISKFFIFLIVLSFVSLIGVLWEFHEFLYDILISPKASNMVLQMSSADTMKDLFFDLFGGLAFLSAYFEFDS